MEIKCEKCPTTFDNEGKIWMKMCKPCYAKSKEVEATNDPTSPKAIEMANTAVRIARSVALAQATEIFKGKAPADVLDLAEAYTHWVLTGQKPERALKVEEEKVQTT